MTVTVASFRQSFGTVFASAVTYPDTAVDFWLGIARLMLTRYWGSPSATADVPPTTKYDWGTMLFAAHNLILEQNAAKAAARGATPGLNTGPISSESVGPASRSYATGDSLELEAGHWNLTIYGTRFVRLANMVGAGPVTINGGNDPYGWGTVGGAWLGPPPYPGWFG